MLAVRLIRPLLGVCEKLIHGAVNSCIVNNVSTVKDTNSLIYTVAANEN